MDACIDICLHVYMCVDVYEFVPEQMCADVCGYGCGCRCVDVDVYTCLCVWMYMHACVDVCVDACVDVYKFM